MNLSEQVASIIEGQAALNKAVADALHVIAASVAELERRVDVICKQLDDRDAVGT